MTTIGQAVDRTLNTWLLGTYRTQMNSLADAATTTGTTLVTTADTNGVGYSSIIAVDDELMFVSGASQGQKRLTVVRGIRGTTPTAHAQDAVIDINPRFPRVMVRDNFRAEIDSWPGSLYRAIPVEVACPARGGVLDVGAALALADPSADPLGVIRVRRSSLNISDERTRPTQGYEVQFDLVDPGDMVVSLNCNVDVATTFKVLVACRFDSSTLTDATDFDDLGLGPGMSEVLELGAAYRLMTGRGSPRLFPEGEGQSRNAAEVGAQDIPSFARGFLQLHERAITREANTLYRRWGFGGRNR